RRELGEVQARLAVLEERRLAAGRELHALQQNAADLEDKNLRSVAQIRQSEEQQNQTRQMIVGLEESRSELAFERDQLNESISGTSLKLEDSRRDLREAEHGWDDARGALDSWKDRNNALEIEKTQVDSDLKHLASSCWNELNETIESVCLK